MKQQHFTLITGASEGFGRALAIECAGRGMNLILVALPDPELEELAIYIRENTAVTVLCFDKDLSEERHCYDLFEEIKKLPVTINMLINNVGIGSTSFFRDTSPAFFEKQIRLNISATTLITRLFLEKLVANKHSYILNVGSLSSYFFLPKKSVYGSTKSYIYYFSKSLKRELRSFGVHVSVVCPGGMNTNAVVTFQNRCSTWFARNSAMNPEEVAAISINGLLDGKAVIIPGMINQFFKLVDHFLPQFIKTYLTDRQMKTQQLPPLTVPGIYKVRHARPACRLASLPVQP
jgi:short-subunit dehydrogenase